MENKMLRINLDGLTAHRQSRNRTANLIFEQPELLYDLIRIAIDTNNTNHHKACWVLELVFEKHIGWLSPHLNSLCRNLPDWNHDGAVRSISKICLFAAKNHTASLKKSERFLTPEQLTQITEACFDWLINEVKVAAKAYAMRTLFETGKQLDWIYPELKIILEQDYTFHSAAYKAAAKELLKKINQKQTCFD